MYSIHLELVSYFLEFSNKDFHFFLLLHISRSNGKHSKLKRVNRAKHKKKKKKNDFIAS